MPLEPLPRHGQGGSIIGGRRGTGQDELARRVALDNCSPDMIPDGGFNLPLIDKTRRIARQYQAGINRNCLTGVFIDIKQYFTGGQIPGCFSVGRKVVNGYSL